MGVQLLKKQNQNTLKVNETHEKILQEKIYNLDYQIQLAIVKAKKNKQREAKDKHHVETTKWKALTLEQSTKAILYDIVYVSYYYL